MGLNLRLPDHSQTLYEPMLILAIFLINCTFEKDCRINQPNITTKTLQRDKSIIWNDKLEICDFGGILI